MVFFVRALYKYEGKTKEELSFGEDDIFEIVNCESDWYVGKNITAEDNLEGLIPSNYIEVLQLPRIFGRSLKNFNTNYQHSNHFKVEKGDKFEILRGDVKGFLVVQRKGEKMQKLVPSDAIFIEFEFPKTLLKAFGNFKKKENKELSLKKGDLLETEEEFDANDWVYGKNKRNGKKGYFPGNAVDLLKQKAKDVIKLYIARADWKAEKKTDISIRDGDLIAVVYKYEDGFWYSMNLRTNERGLVPKTFLLHVHSPEQILGIQQTDENEDSKDKSKQIFTKNQKIQMKKKEPLISSNKMMFQNPSFMLVNNIKMQNKLLEMQNKKMKMENQKMMNTRPQNQNQLMYKSQMMNQNMMRQNMMRRNMQQMQNMKQMAWMNPYMMNQFNRPQPKPQNTKFSDEIPSAPMMEMMNQSNQDLL